LNDLLQSSPLLVPGSWDLRFVDYESAGPIGKYR